MTKTVAEWYTRTVHRGIICRAEMSYCTSRAFMILSQTSQYVIFVSLFQHFIGSYDLTRDAELKISTWVFKKINKKFTISLWIPALKIRTTFQIKLGE
jgi:hypothetical protein